VIAPGSAAPRDDVLPLYNWMIALGSVALVILGIGLVDFFAFEPIGQSTGAHATVQGIYRQDPGSGQVTGPPKAQFGPDEPFAAVVDWTSLPPTMVVAAHWFNTLGQDVGGVGPAPAGQLLDKTAIPVKTRPEFKHNVPGEYTFLVERYSDGQAVEVLARRLVLVRAAP
jgi:hypothetical protein